MRAPGRLVSLQYFASFALVFKLGKGRAPLQLSGKLSQQFNWEAVGWCVLSMDPTASQPWEPCPRALLMYQGIYSRRCQEFGWAAAGEDNKFLFRRNVPP